MSEQKDLNRREFIKRTSSAAAAIAAAAGLAYWTYDSKGPTADSFKTAGIALPDFSTKPVPEQTLAIVKNSDRVAAVQKAIDLLGGIERFVQKGDTVVVKPNVAFASSPAIGATTNPELVAEVVRLCYARGGARKVYVLDNPINDPASCFRLSMIGSAATNAGAEVVLPREQLFTNATLEGGRLIRDWPVFFEPLAKADKLIGISPVKDHHRSGASMSMKNWYGLLGGRRNIFHQDIYTIISELATFVKPTFVILDGTTSMISNGPTGGSFEDLRDTNTMIASCDMVAADTYGASLLDLKIEDLPYLTKAQQAGVGTTDYMSLKPKIAG